MEKKISTIRQGDLLFIPVDSVPEYIEKNSRREDGVIQEGEATGHHHRIAVLENAEVFCASTDTFVKVGPNGVSIVHQEHGPVTLDANTAYKVNRAREFDYLTRFTRYIAD